MTKTERIKNLIKENDELKKENETLKKTLKDFHIKKKRARFGLA